MDSIRQAIDFLKDIAPFSALTAGTVPSPNKVLVQRIFEMVIVVAATGGMVYGIMTTKFVVVEKAIDEIKKDIKQLRRDLYVPRFNGNKGL